MDEDQVDCCEGVDSYRPNGEVYAYECGCIVNETGEVEDEGCEASKE